MEVLILLLIKYGPLAFALLMGILIPQEKMPILKRFMKRASEELNKEPVNDDEESGV